MENNLLSNTAHFVLSRMLSLKKKNLVNLSLFNLSLKKSQHFLLKPLDVLVIIDNPKKSIFKTSIYLFTLHILEPVQRYDSLQKFSFSPTHVFKKKLHRFKLLKKNN